MTRTTSHQSSISPAKALIAVVVLTKRNSNYHFAFIILLNTSKSVSKVFIIFIIIIMVCTKCTFTHIFALNQKICFWHADACSCWSNLWWLAIFFYFTISKLFSWFIEIIKAVSQGNHKFILQASYRYTPWRNRKWTKVTFVEEKMLQIIITFF